MLLASEKSGPVTVVSLKNNDQTALGLTSGHGCPLEFLVQTQSTASTRQTRKVGTLVRGKLLLLAQAEW
jgi:hypothetical protein